MGHSLGGATASLLAIMLRKKSFKELGFSPDIVSAVGYATPPCVSRELAESCSDFVTTVVMQVGKCYASHYLFGLSIGGKKLFPTLCL